MGKEVFWQFHQSSTDERPGNTIPAFLYAWELGGIPEADIRTTSDGVIVAFHDDTPARRTDAPPEWKDRSIRSIPLKVLKSFNAGGEGRFKGTRAPTLAEAFAELAKDKNRRMYLDYKDCDITQLGRLADSCGVMRQLIFTNRDGDLCRRVHSELGIPTMRWLGGTPEQIWQAYEGERDIGFPGLSQVQLHLNPPGVAGTGEWPFVLPPEKVAQALAECTDAGVDLEVLIRNVDPMSSVRLLDLGVRWYATDFPEAFVKILREWQSK